MCIGIAMQVTHSEAGGLFAECADGQRRERLDMRLIGAQPVGTWVLAFLGAARRVLDAEEAAQIRSALLALEGALRGDDPASFDLLFADLTQREPQLPAHLRPPAAAAADADQPRPVEPQVEAVHAHLRQAPAAEQPRNTAVRC